MRKFLREWGIVRILLLGLLITVGIAIVKQPPNPRVKEWLDSARVIYKLENGHYTQITSFEQIKDGVYIIIR